MAHRCFGKTAGEMHGCQSRGKCSIIQAEIALLTLTPFPLRSQGSCWVVALDGLLNASLSGVASLMNTAVLAAAPPVAGVSLLKAAAPRLCLFIALSRWIPYSPLIVHMSTCNRGGRRAKFDHDMTQSSVRFLSTSRTELLLTPLFAQSVAEALLFGWSSRAYLNSQFAKIFWEACPSACNLFWFYTSGSFIMSRPVSASVSPRLLN